MDEIGKIGIVANSTKPKAAEVLKRLGNALIERNFTLVLNNEAAGLAGTNGLATPEVFAGSDMVIVLGGDGTILSAARKMGDSPRPIMGINIGTLGFLTCMTDQDLESVPDLIANEDLSVSPRVMLDVRLKVDGKGQDRMLGLNEVTLTRGTISRIIKVETLINGEFLNSFYGDGLIVATPTGSTAYSLSAGGPIVDPESGVFVITPICPHALSNRSMVVRDHLEVELVAQRASDEVLLTVDGQTVESVPASASVVIRRHKHTVPLVFPCEHSFYNTLRQKLHWHGSNV